MVNEKIKDDKSKTTNKSKDEKKRLKLGKMLSRRVFALGLGLWFLGMTLITWAVAEDMLSQVKDGIDITRYQAENSRISSSIPEDMPGVMEISMIKSFGTPYRHIQIKKILPFVRGQKPNELGSDDWIWGKWSLVYGFEAAISIHDWETETLFVSGDYLTFSYIREGGWEHGEIEADGLSYIALDKLDDEGGLAQLEVERMPNDFVSSYKWDYHTVVGSSFYPAVLRLVGYFEGNEFHPVTVESGSYIDPETGDAERRLNELRWLWRQDKVKWTTLFTSEAVPEQATETIYAWNLLDYRYDDRPVTVKGTTYSGLPELLFANAGTPTSQENNLLESVIVRYYHPQDMYGRFTYMIVVRCHPLHYAILRMMPAYLISFALVYMAIRLISRKWRKRIIEPLSYLAHAAEDGRIHPSCPVDEIYRLETYVADTHRRQAETQNEIQQLCTALDYAKDAEEKRRQLISNITHELKTPLAVIHSYAEGLQAGIAAEKQEQYLSVIRGEAEHMDEMVLQMLELSRLEAGKVRLAVDQFSLLQLTTSVAEKFAPMLEAKELTFNYGLAEEFQITADEGRIRQVITNLISNALKYTPRGGRIMMNIFVENHSARLTISNTTAHLSDEALLKVWDSFYRADPSRTEPGTGLGLTLVKSIVELHRGVCYVRNTTDKTEETVMDAVEFGFTIPMR